MKSRVECLQALLQYDRPIKDITTALKSYGWDCEEKLVSLTSNHIRSLLLRFLAGELAAKDVEVWANATEGRDDIGVEVGHEQFLTDMVFVLANPLLNDELTADSAAALLAQLSNH